MEKAAAFLDTRGCAIATIKSGVNTSQLVWDLNKIALASPRKKGLVGGGHDGLQRDHW